MASGLSGCPMGVIQEKQVRESMGMRRVHNEITIVDGLIFMADYMGELLIKGGVDAANVTVNRFQDDFAGTCDDIAKWHEALSKPGCTWHPVLRLEDIFEAKKNGKVGLIMGFQNARPVEDKLERLAFFYALGVRVIQMTYNERNFVGDGCMEDSDAGLSVFGKRAVDELNRLGIAIDISHCGERTSRDTIERSAVPPLITHANARKLADRRRNKTDEFLKYAASAGCTVGVSIHGMMCWDGNPNNPPALANYIRHINYMRDLIGINFLTMGTDFHSLSDARMTEATLANTVRRYGARHVAYITAFGDTLSDRFPKDCNTPADLRRLADALLAGGWNENDLKAFYGDNIVRALGRAWSYRARARASDK
jgi:membrane dipeptidase